MVITAISTVIWFALKKTHNHDISWLQTKNAHMKQKHMGMGQNHGSLVNIKIDGIYGCSSTQIWHQSRFWPMAIYSKMQRNINQTPKEHEKHWCVYVQRNAIFVIDT